MIRIAARTTIERCPFMLLEWYHPTSVVAIEPG
jgi:hypothetical protein